MANYKSGKVLRIFSDESGSPERFIAGVNSINDKFFAICAVLIRQKEYKKFKRQLSLLQKRYAKYLKGQEIKSRSVRRSNPKSVDPGDPPEYDFHKYLDGHAVYDAFCEELKTLVKKTPFQLLSVATDKVIAQEKYPRHNILLTLLGDLWERIAIVHHLEKIRSSYIIFDPDRTEFLYHGE